MREEPRLARVIERLDRLVDWEKRDRSPSMRRGLEPVADLLRRLGMPHQRFRAVHVAGTKGKGTTAALIAAGLARAGLSVGLYTSPHVDTVRERVAIDGELVGADELAAALERGMEARVRAESEGGEARAATWFDVLTAAAFVVFAERGIEWAVVECGLGGRLDSTNVVRGEVCVVTNIDLEHTAVLGASPGRIAFEKGGIVKRGSRLVTGVDPAGTHGGLDAGAVLDEVARSEGVPVVRPSGPAWERGTMLERDAALARLVLDELGGASVLGRDGAPVAGARLDPAAVQAARLPGRLDRFEVGGVPVAVDVAHVAGSIGRVLDELGADPALPGAPVVVLALGRDKDLGRILKALLGRADTVVCTSPTTGPLRKAEELEDAARAHGLAAESEPAPERALRRALELARGRTWVLVIGSFHLAGAVRAELSALAGEPTETP
jgi:dihydrofolate synthase/folylpolyglutamate synthase